MDPAVFVLDVRDTFNLQENSEGKLDILVPCVYVYVYWQPLPLAAHRAQWIWQNKEFVSIKIPRCFAN